MTIASGAPTTALVNTAEGERLDGGARPAVQSTPSGQTVTASVGLRQERTRRPLEDREHTELGSAARTSEHRSARVAHACGLVRGPYDERARSRRRGGRDNGAERRWHPVERAALPISGEQHIFANSGAGGRGRDRPDGHGPSEDALGDIVGARARLEPRVQSAARDRNAHGSDDDGRGRVDDAVRGGENAIGRDDDTAAVTDTDDGVERVLVGGDGLSADHVTRPRRRDSGARRRRACPRGALRPMQRAALPTHENRDLPCGRPFVSCRARR